MLDHVNVKQARLFGSVFGLVIAVSLYCRHVKGDRKMSAARATSLASDYRTMGTLPEA